MSKNSNNMVNVSLIDSVDSSLLNDGLLSVSDRYYEHKYPWKLVDDKKTHFIHQRVSFHSNRICMLSLAENHPIIKNDLIIKTINFDVNNINRLDNKTSGKRKRGAQMLSVNSIICNIETEDGGNFPIYSTVRGKLIEINEVLVENPNLLKDKPVSDGYLALILPILHYYEETKKVMLTKDEYLKACNDDLVDNKKIECIIDNIIN